MTRNDKWTVYEYLKTRTLATGHIPTRQELDAEFVGIDPEEVEDGIQEFTSRISRWAEAI
ncbi:hypothetical protein [Paenibacillus sp. OAE614]|uniref:hypothetical protein n=1 Tax=Paenibacillus sp. OAE614 TaxID=2663804 RepID=UPI00178A45B4